MDFQQTTERQRLKKAMDYGITMGFLAALDCFETTLRKTKGIGPKRRVLIMTQLETVYQEIRRQYSSN